MVTTGMIRRPVRGRAKPSDARAGPTDVNLTTRAREDENTSYSIMFELSTNTMVTLAIFSDDGRLVDIPFEGWLWPGRHTVACSLKDQSPGTYKCLLDTPTVRLVKYIEVVFP